MKEIEAMRLSIKFPIVLVLLNLFCTPRSMAQRNSFAAPQPRGVILSDVPPQVKQAGDSINEIIMPVRASAETAGFVVVRYKLDASQRRFMVTAFAGGLLWFKGHDHFIAVRDFSGEA